MTERWTDERLDRFATDIEREIQNILSVQRELQETQLRQTESNSRIDERLDRLTETTERNSKALDRLTETTERNSNAIAQLISVVTAHQDSMEQLKRTTDYLISKDGGSEA